MIRRLWKTLKLGFDRSFSGASWKQITWLFGILALVLGFSLWIKSFDAQLKRYSVRYEKIVSCVTSLKRRQHSLLLTPTSLAIISRVIRSA